MSDTVNTTLRRNALGVGAIVFLVLAAVAPLTGLVVVASLAMLFAIGYGKMSSELVNAGGFYAFVVKGLGRPAGLAAGFIAMLGYNFFVVGTIGTSRSSRRPPDVRGACHLAHRPPGDLVEVEGLGTLRNHMAEGPTPTRGDAGAQPTESEKVLSTAEGGDREFRGIREPNLSHTH